MLLVPNCSGKARQLIISAQAGLWNSPVLHTSGVAANNEVNTKACSSVFVASSLLFVKWNRVERVF